MPPSCATGNAESCDFFRFDDEAINFTPSVVRSGSDFLMWFLRFASTEPCQSSKVMSTGGVLT